MNTLNVMLSNLDGKIIPLGYEGENLYTRVRINCIEVFAEYPDAVVSMVVRPPVGDIYPAVVEKSGVMVVWDITDSVLSSSGQGQVQLTFTDDETIRKSVIFGISINSSLVASGEAPEPVQEWIDSANETAHQIAHDAAMEAAEEVIESIPADYTQLSNDVQDLKSAFEQLNDNVITESAGPAPIVSIADGADGMPMRSVEVAIEPVQDLHGYDNPWPAGGGKNKWNQRGVGYYASATGEWTTTGSATWYIGTQKMSATPGDTLVVSTTKSIGTCYMPTWNGDVWKGAPSVAKSGPVNGRYYYTFTVPTDVDTIAFNVDCQNVDTVPTVTDLMLESGLTPTTYEPYSNVCPISGWTGAKVTRTGKNLLNPLVEGYWNGQTGQPMPASSYWRSEKIKVESGATYYANGISTISAWVKWKKGGASSGAGAGLNIVTVSDDEYIAFYCLKTAVDNVNAVQVTKGETSETLPITGQTYEVTFPSSAGTVYGGTLDVTAGTLTVDRAVVDLGSITWAYSNGAFYTSGFTAKERGGECLCTCYKGTGEVLISDMPDMSIQILTGTYCAVVKDSRYTDATTFKSALTTDNVKLCYELATPVLIENLDQDTITTLLGVNNIWADTGNVSVDYPADTKMYIDNRINSARKLIAGIETGFTASKAYSVGDMLIIGDDLYKVASSIASGATITVGTNVTKTTVAEQLIALANA